MDDRDILISLNETLISEDEIKEYEKTHGNLDKLKEIENRISKRILKDSLHKCICTVIDEQLEEEEEVIHIFLGSAYGARGSQIWMGMLLGGISSAVWGDWGRNLAVLLTNKRVFVIYANIIWECLKVRKYKFGEIDHIRYAKDTTDRLLTIKLKNRDADNSDIVKIVTYNDDCKRTFDYIHKNYTDMKIIIEQKKKGIKLIKIIPWILVIVLTIFLLVGFTITWIFPTL